jgi:PAS domain S-box-containing protein
VNHRAILDCASVMIFALEPRGRLTYFNARAAEALGYTPAAARRLVGQHFFDIVAPGAHADAAARIRRAMERPLEDHDFRIAVQHRDGTAVTLDIQMRTLWQNGKAVGRVGVARVASGESESVKVAVVERAVREERELITARLLDRVPEIVQGVGVERTVASPVDAAGAKRAELARRASFDETDVEILRLLTSGASNQEISRQIHLSIAAVKDRIGRLMRRLGARRRAELSAQALRAGIV